MGDTNRGQIGGSVEHKVFLPLRMPAYRLQINQLYLLLAHGRSYMLSVCSMFTNHRMHK